jgi:hypothetical protein
MLSGSRLDDGARTSVRADLVRAQRQGRGGEEIDRTRRRRQRCQRGSLLARHRASSRGELRLHRCRSRSGRKPEPISEYATRSTTGLRLGGPSIPGKSRSTQQSLRTSAIREQECNIASAVLQEASMRLARSIAGRLLLVFQCSGCRSRIRARAILVEARGRFSCLASCRSISQSRGTTRDRRQRAKRYVPARQGRPEGYGCEASRGWPRRADRVSR